MPRRTDNLDLDVDLQGGVVPISKASSSLAALIKRARERRQPIIVTQKGYPTGVILPIELYVTLRELAERNDGAREAQPPSRTDEAEPPATPVAVTPADEPPPPVQPSRPRGRGGRKAGQIRVPEPAGEPSPPEPASIVPAEPSKPRGRGGRKARAQA